MYKATKSFVMNENYYDEVDIKKNQILPADFVSQEFIDELLEAGYIVEYDGSLEITENGIYNVKDYDSVDVNVSGGTTAKIQPTLLTFANYQGTSLDVSNIDVSRMTTIGNMFSGCYNLEELDLSGFYTSNITAMNNTFQNCRSLQKLDIRNFDFTNVTNSNNMFSQVSSSCLVIVKGQTEKDWILSKATLNVKTVAEL